MKTHGVGDDEEEDSPIYVELSCQSYQICILHNSVGFAARHYQCNVFQDRMLFLHAIVTAVLHVFKSKDSV